MIYVKDIDSVWDKVSPLIQKALDHSCGELAIQDVYRKLQDGHMGLIMNDKMACVVEFMDYPQITALRVVALGGEDMDEWLEELLDILYKWAKENGHSRVEHMGRKGWVKTLQKYGYEPRYVFMTREIDHG